MNGKQLKNSILQWAIQGKLVPQDPNDEPANVLLDKIRQEKEHLIKEKRIKRDKNASIIYRGEDNSYYEKLLATGEVKCVDEEVPFEIPKGWEWCRLSALTTRFSTGPFGTMLHKEDYTDNGVAVINPTNIINHKISFSNIKQISLSKAKELQGYAVNKGDIILARRGDLRKSAIITDFEDSSIAGTGSFIIHLLGVVNSFFILFYGSPYVQDYLITDSVGTTMNNLNQKLLSRLLIPIPPCAEQVRIVSVVDELFSLVNTYDMMKNKLDILNSSLHENIKKSILQEAIQGKLVPQIAEEGTAKELLEQIKAEKQKLVKEGKLKKSALKDSVIFRGDDNKYYEQIGKTIVCIDEEIPFPIPNNWAWSRLSSMCSIVNGFTPLRSESKFWDCGTINWFTVEDIKNQGEMIYATKQKITDEATSKERIVRAGSVLLCCTASVGQCALAMIDLTTNQQFNALTVEDVNRSILTDNYLFWFAKTLKTTLQRLSGKTTFEFVSVKKVGNILIPIPPFQEQQRIVTQIEKLFEQLR